VGGRFSGRGAPFPRASAADLRPNAALRAKRVTSAQQRVRVRNGVELRGGGMQGAVLWRSARGSRGRREGEVSGGGEGRVGIVMADPRAYDPRAYDPHACDPLRTGS